MVLVKNKDYRLSQLERTSERQSACLAQALKEKNDALGQLQGLQRASKLAAQETANLRAELQQRKERCPYPRYNVGDVVVDIVTVRRISRIDLRYDLKGRPAYFYEFEGNERVWSHENLLKPLPNKGKGYLKD